MLQFDTKDYPEQKRGMLICGINWGGNPAVLQNDPNRARYHRSFFSDDSNWVMNACKYRSRVLSWLRCLGLELESSPDRAGRLERSISQVNWLPTQSQNTHGQVNLQACAANWEFFLSHMRAVKPSLILFLSTDLLRALNTDPCLSQAMEILGKPGDMQFEHRDLVRNGMRHPRLKVGKQIFPEATAIALPHPGYRKGIADEYIKCFRNWIGEELREYARSQQSESIVRVKAAPDASSSVR